MLLYRSFVVGLLGAIALLVATRPGPRPAPPSWPARATDLTIVNASVSRSVDQQVAFGDELGLRDGEQVIATRCTPSYAVGCTLRPGEYAEVTVAGPEGHRSILVLMRP